MTRKYSQNFIKHFLLFFLLLFIVTGSIFLFRHFSASSPKASALARLASEEYDSIFCSSYSLENYVPEDFITYRGLNTLLFQMPVLKFTDFSDYLDAAFASDNIINTVYLGLDPQQLWISSGRNADRFTEELTQTVLTYVTAHPDVSFEIMLSHPSLQYWVRQSDDEISEALHAYSALIATLDHHANVTMYYLGAERWLIANPGNYSDEFSANEIVSHKNMLFTFCDHLYQINAQTAPDKLAQLADIIAQEKRSPAVYPDLSSWDMVFFGDSIIGHYIGSTSIPGVVNGLTAARIYNCAKSGIPASVHPDHTLSFPESVKYFLTQDVASVPEDAPFAESLERYIQDDHADRKLCFVLNYGLNDYYTGQPVDNTADPQDASTYAGALRTGITALQEAYPDARIILMTPSFTTYFSDGSEPQSQNGGILTEYVDAAEAIAAETGCILLNNYLDLGITADNAGDYLEDGCHPNETMRFMMAEQIIGTFS